MYTLGIDVGGTFTDFVLRDEENGELRTFKHLTVPSDVVRGIVSGIEAFLDAEGVPLESVREIRHATTLGSNAIIQRDFARPGLVTTRGFRDVLHVQRALRYHMFNLHIRKVEPLVPRRHIFEVTERLAYDGSVVTPLAEDEVREVATRIRAAGIETVAVVLLHSYANPSHEQRIRDILTDEVDDVTVTLSSEVSLEAREYERTSTTVVNACLRPIFARYLGELRDWLTARRFTGQLLVMQSTGGLMAPAAVERTPVRVIESGPAAGIIAARHFGRTTRTEDVVAFDMGGTTAKVGVVRADKPLMVRMVEVAHLVPHKRGSGIPLDIDAIDLVEIGAGGGSIARPHVGALQVGPESAGADPAPICYGRGGTEPTVTDANLVLGYLNPANFLGGRMPLDLAAARDGLGEKVGTAIGLDPVTAAWGVHRLVNANMAHAVRQMSVARGLDPRRFTLVATGGAAPAHASRLARELGVPRVLIPALAGVASALGLLVADLRIDLSRTLFAAVDANLDEVVHDMYTELRKRLLDEIAQSAPAGDVTVVYGAALRYEGQGFEVPVTVPVEELERGGAEALVAAFRREYGRLYGETPDEPVQVVRWSAAAICPSPSFPTARWRGAGRGDALKEHRQVYFPECGGFTRTAIYDRASLAPDAQVRGPAVIEDPESTTVLLPGDRATVDDAGNVLITTEGDPR